MLHQTLTFWIYYLLPLTIFFFTFLLKQSNNKLMPVKIDSLLYVDDIMLYTNSYDRMKKVTQIKINDN